MVPNFGWRWLYLIGAVPGVLAVVLAKAVPESPRWLLWRTVTWWARRSLSPASKATSSRRPARPCRSPW
ncbi:MAG: MFS transporter [Haloechinothrix sp.]